MEPNLVQNNPTPQISEAGSAKDKVLILIGAIVVIGAILYFFFYKSSPVSQNGVSRVQAKLIDQQIRVITGVVAGMDADKRTFSLYTENGQTHQIAVLPQTVIIGFNALDPKSVTTGEDISMNKFKNGLNVEVNYIDAEKEVGLLYASIIDKKE